MHNTRIPFREKIQLLLQGAGTIVGVSVSEPARHEDIIAGTPRADVEEIREWVNTEIKGSGTSSR